MEQQAELFHADVYAALQATCHVIGGGGRNWAKVTGSMLWPAKSPDDAGKYLANCLDRDRNEKLDPEQVLWIAREGKRKGCHYLMAFICDDAEYQRTNPIEPEDERASLQRDFIQGVRHLSAMAKRLEQMDKQ